MKTLYLKAISLTLLVCCGGIFATTISAANYITINGIVKDKQTNKKLEYVTISVAGTSIGTVTNEDGVFSIKVNDSLQVNTIEFSHIGYSKQTLPIVQSDMETVTVYMTPNVHMLRDVIIEVMNPRSLVESAIRKIKDNNSSTENMFTGFYRETIRKRRNYINISEAITHIYKTPYTEDITRDKVQIFKGRQLLSPKAGDTLIVKLQGGPNLSTFVDIVKNPDLILDPASLGDYKFAMEESAMINEKPHYVVSFKPQRVYPYPLHYGKLYIDKETLAFSRAEFSLNMDDDNKATRAILRKKPFNLRFKPQEVSFFVTYKQENGKSYLNYIRNEVRFKCDWKRRLFSTGYTIVSEMVMTDRQEENVAKIPNKLAFNEKQILSDKVSNFYDANFWEDYNIIEPTESLENAVNKLKKRHNQ